MRRKKKKDDRNDWPVAAGLFIGIGVGLYTREVAAFTLMGLGLGLLITFLLTRK
jgi:hypothetical protein